MKKRLSNLLFALAMFIVAAIVIVIVVYYFNFISRRIYEDSTKHVEEIYVQVNNSFGAFVERNWGLLKSWDVYIDNEDDGKISSFINGEKNDWGFTEFYFLSSDSCMTLDGSVEELDLGDGYKMLSQEKKPLFTGVELSGQDVTMFAVPADKGSYNGFEYDSLAVCYTNDDIAASLNVDAFGGQAKCFILSKDGSVLISTQPGANVYANYLVYLKAVSDLSESQMANLRSDWDNNKSGLLQCTIGGESQCILYQPVGYQDYILLSVVPQNVVSAGFLSIQKTTVYVLITIFLLIGAAVITFLIRRNHRLSVKSETELQYRELMFGVLSNNVDDIFIMLDHDNQQVDYISPNIERLLGIPVEEARKDIRVMKKCAVNFDVVIPKEVLNTIPLNGNKYWECEYMHQNTGERRWYRMTVYNMSIQDVSKYIIVLSDRTQDQQLNQKLQEALNAARSANEAKSNFLSNMSHDIRTPMNAIVGFATLLENNADQPDKVKEYTHKITASSHHLLSLINDVLDMSKIESGKTSLNVDRFSLPELMEELNIILMPQAKAKKQTFKIHVQGASPEQMIGDKLRLNQILINLLSNAIKYTPVGGNIDFTVSEIPQQSQQQYVKLKFVVKDNGIGMSEEFQKNIFAPFSREISSVTNKIQGTGLGMAITKNLVDLMGGIITLESAPGKGSTFTVELTFVIPEPEEADMWFKHEVKRVLVADDEEEICLDIKELMKDTGVNVSSVNDGESAVKEAVRAHDAGEDYDVILLDWKMPVMDGVATARLIRERIGKDIPILVLTSHDWEEIETEARQAGIDAFMSKPFFVSSFWQTIKPLFSKPEEEETVTPAVPATETVLNGKLFLVAEDNELNAEILTEMMGMHGASCELAVNGQEAVDMFLRSEAGHYDMILMDVQMPIMNGYEATRKIRSSSHPEAKTIPIAAMTANTFAEDVRNALDAGMNGHLAKPIDMNAVIQMVDKLLNQNDPYKK